MSTGSLESPVSLPFVSLDCVRNSVYAEGTQVNTDKISKLHTERPQARFKPTTFLLWGSSAAHCTTNTQISETALACLTCTATQRKDTHGEIRWGIRDFFCHGLNSRGSGMLVSISRLIDRIQLNHFMPISALPVLKVRLNATDQQSANGRCKSNVKTLLYKLYICSLSVEITIRR